MVVKSSIFNIYKVYILKTASTGSGNFFNEFGQFLAWAWLDRPKAIVVIPKINSCQNHLRTKRSESAKYPWPLCYKKKFVEITMHLGLDNIIKLKFITNFDRCAILNVLNCLTKEFLAVTSLLITRN